MNYWKDGNHQQPRRAGREMPPWLPGALFYAVLAVLLIAVIVLRWVL